MKKNVRKLYDILPQISHYSEQCTDKVSNEFLFLLDLSEKDCTKICFLPTATGDNDNYIVRFYSIFTRLNCIPTHIEFFK